MGNKYAVTLKIFFVLIPLCYFTSTLDPVLVPRQILLASFLGVMLALLISERRDSFNMNVLNEPAFLFLLLFFLFCVASLIPSLNKSETMYFISKAGTVMAYLVLVYLLLNKSLLTSGDIAEGVVMLLFISDIIGVYQAGHVFAGRLPVDDAAINSIKSTMANKNLFCSLSVVSFPFLYRGLYGRRFICVLSGLSIASTLLFLLMLQSRSALLGMAVIYLFLVYDVFLRDEKKEATSKKILFGVLSVFIVAVVSVYAAQRVSSRGSAQSSFSHLANAHTAETRVKLWHNSLRMLYDYPLGVGGGNWQIYFPEYGLESFDSPVGEGWSTFQRPHNDFLWIACETGIAGLACYLLFFVFVFRRGINRLKNKASFTDERPFLLPALAGIAAYLVISFFDFPFERIEHQVVLYSLAAVVLAGPLPVAAFKRVGNKWIVAFLVMLTCFSLTVGLYRLLGEMHSNRLIKAHYRADWRMMIAESDRATTIFYNMDCFSAPVSWYKGVALFSLGDIEKATDAFEDAFRVNPFNIHVLNNVATCYEKKGRHAEAMRLYEEALTLSPVFRECRLNLSACYFNAGKIEDAYRTIVACDVDMKDEKYKTFIRAIIKRKLESPVGDTAKMQVLSRRLDDDRFLADVIQKSEKDSADLIETILKFAE